MESILPEYLRQVTPEIDCTEWHPDCPVCSDGQIKLDTSSYLAYANRHFCYGSCESCGSNFLLDVPTLLYNFLYPQIMDLETGEMYGKNITHWRDDMFNFYISIESNLNSEIRHNVELRKAIVLKGKIKRTFFSFLKTLDLELLSTGIRKYIAQRKPKNQDLVSTKPSLKIIKQNREDSSKVLLLNCLDDYYGHTTRFIQFAYSTYNEIGEHLKEHGIRFALLIPEAVDLYIPDFIDEVWLATHLPKPFGRGTFQDAAFNRQLNEEIRSRHRVYLLRKKPDIGLGVDPKVYFHLDALEEKATLQIKDHSPIFVFYHREDYRCWGGHPKTELRNYSKLANLLNKTYPSAGIYLVGLKERYPIRNPYVIDLRGKKLSTDYREARVNYLYLLSKADCSIGIHGSHITEMSALSASTVIFQPKFKYSNYSDELFLIESSHFVAKYQSIFSLFGNNDLDDIFPDRVFDIIQAALHRQRQQYLN